MAADRAEASEAALLHGELAHGPGATRARVLLQTTVAGHAGIRCTAGQRQNNNRLALLALVVISFVDDTGHNSATDTKNVSKCVITTESVISFCTVTAAIFSIRFPVKLFIILQVTENILLHTVMITFNV